MDATTTEDKKRMSCNILYLAPRIAATLLRPKLLTPLPRSSRPRNFVRKRTQRGFVFAKIRRPRGKEEYICMPTDSDKGNNIPKYLCILFLSTLHAAHPPFIHSTSTNRPASHAFFAALCSASISPLISHMPLKMASLPSFFSNSYGCPYSTTQPLSSTNTLS